MIGDEMLMPRSVEAFAVDAEPLGGGPPERFLLLEFEGRDLSYKVLLTKAGASLVADKLASTVEHWSDDGPS